MAGKVGFHVTDAAGLGDRAFDAAFAFECVHDMPYPVEVLSAIRAAVRPGGPVVVMDEAVNDAFAAPGDDTERLMYGFSTLVCLPDGLAHPDSVGTGTVMRLETLRGYARAAGFADVEVLPDRGVRVLALLPPGVRGRGRAPRPRQRVAVPAICGLIGRNTVGARYRSTARSAKPPEASAPSVSRRTSQPSKNHFHGRATTRCTTP